MCQGKLNYNNMTGRVFPSCKTFPDLLLLHTAAAALLIINFDLILTPSLFSHKRLKCFVVPTKQKGARELFIVWALGHATPAYYKCWERARKRERELNSCHALTEVQRLIHPPTSIIFLVKILFKRNDVHFLDWGRRKWNDKKKDVFLLGSLARSTKLKKTVLRTMESIPGAQNQGRVRRILNENESPAEYFFSFACMTFALFSLFKHIDLNIKKL